jgi:hypothetical protein
MVLGALSSTAAPSDLAAAANEDRAILNGLVNPGDGTANSGGIVSPGWSVLSFNRTLPMTVGNYVEIGTLVPANGAANLRVSLVVNSSGFSVARQYLVGFQYARQAAGTYDMTALTSTGPYAGENFQLEILSDGANVSTLRVRRLSGTTPGTVTCTIENLGGSLGLAPFTPSSGTGTSASIGALWAAGGAVGNGSIYTSALQPNAVILPLADTVLPGTVTTTTTGTWVVALTTASVGCQGGRQRIEFNGVFTHSAAPASVYTGVGVDGAVSQALGLSTISTAASYVTVSWVYYTVQPVGNHTFSVWMYNANAGTLTMSNIINSYLHVTEERR